MKIRKNLGITLLELLVVIVILGILIAISYMAFPGTSINLTAQAEQLTNSIRYAQNLSMTKNKRYKIATNESTSSYSIKDSSENEVYNIALGSGVTITPTINIIFNNKGAPYSDNVTPLASTAIIYLNSGEAANQISITPLTGKATHG